MWRPRGSLRTRSSLLHSSSMLRRRVPDWRGSCLRLDVGLWLEELASCLGVSPLGRVHQKPPTGFAFDSLVTWRTLLTSSSKGGQTLATRLALRRVAPRQRLYPSLSRREPTFERVGELLPSRQSNREPTARATGGRGKRRRMAAYSHLHSVAMSRPPHLRGLTFDMSGSRRRRGLGPE